MANYFNPDFAKFFKELAKNNNREWFQMNKDRFKINVEQPFTVFITDLIDALKAINPKMQITAKDAMFRIYRDIRFSKDKTPYKEYISAVVSPGGRKDFTSTGLYIEMNHDGIHVYSGIYQPDTKQLASIRYYIADHELAISKLIKGKRFATRFGSILGEQSKVLPADLKASAVQQALIFNKSFYYRTHLDASWIHSPKLIAELLKCYEDAMPVNQFLEKAIQAGR